RVWGGGQRQAGPVGGLGLGVVGDDYDRDRRRLGRGDRRVDARRQVVRRRPQQLRRRAADGQGIGGALGQVHRYRVGVHRRRARGADDLGAVEGQGGGGVAAAGVGDAEYVGAGGRRGQRPRVTAAERGAARRVGRRQVR